MKTKITTFVMGMLMMASFMTSCDNHEPYDPDLHIGYVLCDDHTCMDTATYFNQSKRKAVTLQDTNVTGCGCHPFPAPCARP